MNDKMEIMNGGKALMKALEKEGVKEVFGLPGGANLPMYDELFKSNIRHILVRHEQSAAHTVSYTHLTLPTILLV